MQRGNLSVNERDFEEVKQLGEGKAGCVRLVRYLGEDPELLAICPTRLYALKMFKQGAVDHNEIEITEAMGLGKFAFYEEKGSQPEETIIHKVLIMSFIHYDAELSSSNLSIFLRQLCNNTRFHIDPDNFVAQEIQEAFTQNNLAITLCQILCSMKKALNKLHGAGFYHFDVALRNFLVAKPILQDGRIIYLSVELVDYGLSHKITEENKGIITISPHQQWPIKCLDKHCLLENEASIATDLYALRIVCLSMLGMLYGKNENDVIRLPSEIKANLSSFLAQFKRQKDDEVRLQIYLERIKKLMIKHNDFRRKELGLFLKCYEPWLTTALNTKDLKDIQSIEQARMNDNVLFLQATDRFLKEISQCQFVQLPKETLKDRLGFLQADFGQREPITPRTERARTAPERPLKCTIENDDYASIVLEDSDNSTNESLEKYLGKKQKKETGKLAPLSNFRLFASKDDGRIGITQSANKIKLRNSRN